MRIVASDTNGYLVWVFASRILITVLASMHWNGLLLAHVKNTIVQPFEAAEVKTSISKRSVSPGLTIQSKIRKREVKIQASKVITTNYQDRLQKRGQCLSSPQRNVAQDEESPRGIERGSRNTRDRTKTNQASSSQTCGRLTSSKSTMSSASQPLRSTKKPVIIPPSAWSPLKQTSSSKQLAKLRHPLAPKNPPGSTLDRKKSAPSLVDLPPVKAFATRQKALIMKDASHPMLQEAIESWNARLAPFAPELQGDALKAEKIKRFDNANAASHAFARQARRVSCAFGSAADASHKAGWPVSARESKCKQESTRLTSDVWKSMAKSNSYASQIQSTALRDMREQQRLISVLMQQESVAETLLALTTHHEDSMNYLDSLGDRYEDVERLRRYHTDALLRHAQENGNDIETMDIAPPLSVGNAIVRPFTPSPASSRGRSDTDERARRKSSGSSTA